MSETGTLYAQAKQRMKELGLEPQKGLGQNFLVSSGVVTKIVAAVQGENPTALLEIGPGVGALTEGLLGLNLPLQLLEFDRQLAKYWRERGQVVIEGDALKADWAELAPQSQTVLVSNLPYQISTSLVVDLSLGPANISSMVLMFQKEVAERLLAKTRTDAYGMLSVMTQSHWQVQRLLEAGPGDFWPAPKIASQVICFKRKAAPYPGREKSYLNFLKGAFSQPRKLLAKNLLARPSKSGLNQEATKQALQDLGLNPMVRAEELTVSQFEQLYAKVGF